MRIAREEIFGPVVSRDPGRLARRRPSRSATPSSTACRASIYTQDINKAFRGHARHVHGDLLRQRPHHRSRDPPALRRHQEHRQRPPRGLRAGARRVLGVEERSTSTTAATCSGPRSTRRRASSSHGMRWWPPEAATECVGGRQGYNSLKGPKFGPRPDDESAPRRAQPRSPQVPDPAPHRDRRAGRLGEPRPRPRPTALLRHPAQHHGGAREAGATSTTRTPAPAGMPTDEGYRVYVDSLDEPRLRCPPATPPPSTPSCGRWKARRPRSWRRLPSPVAPVAQRGLRAGARHRRGPRFRHVDLVRLPHPRILVVMVSLTGLVTNTRHRGRGGAHPGRPAGLRELPERALRGPRASTPSAPACSS